MIKKIKNIKNIIFPNNKINYTLLIILLLGVTFGAIFSTTINQNDKQLVIEKIELFISNINTGRFNNVQALKNSIITNLSYSLIIWILGMTIIGAVINIFLLFLKGFTFGFSLSSFIITYNYKGIILSTIYTLFGQLLNIIVIAILTIYSIMFTLNFIKQIVKNKQNFNIQKQFKNYFLIFVITILISIISSISEIFIFPNIIKLIIKIYL